MCCWDVEWIELAQLAILILGVPVTKQFRYLLLLENLTGFHVVKKFPTFYGTQMFIAAYKYPPPVPILSQINSVHVPHPISEDPF
jgi:hypothetical protein